MTTSPTVDSVEIDNPLGLRLEALDPKTLVIGTNVRVDQKLDADLVASIRERGVKTAINAYRSQGGLVVVLRGQRRTLIAASLGLPLVPVIIEPEPDDADRVVDQLGENDHRAGLGAQEHVDAYEQLAAYGLSVDEIAAMTATNKGRVEYHVADGLKTAAEGVSEDRAQVIALGMVLAAYEDGTDEQAWRIVQGDVHRYLRFLQSCGYELSDVERIAAGLTTVEDVEKAHAELDADGAGAR